MLNRLIDNQYEILAALRTGGRATVHYGWDHQGQRPVAIAEIAGDTAVRRRLAEAIGRSKRLVHPNLVAIHDARVDAENRVYVIMEFLDGMGLDTALERLRTRQKRLSPELGLYITRQILQGLDHIYAHASGAGNVRRPVLDTFSPGDVILIAGGSVKLRGLGLPEDDAGHPKYSEAGENNAAELYDLAVVGRLLYELVVGERPPARGMNSQGDVLRLEGLPKPVAEVVRKAISSRRGVRYETVRDMEDDLGRGQMSLGAGDARTMLADLLDALEDPREAQEHRRLLMMRGGSSTGTQMEAITTTPLSAEALGTDAEGGSDDGAPWEPYPWDSPKPTEPEWSDARPQRSHGWVTIAVAVVLVAYMMADLYWGFGPLSRITGIDLSQLPGEGIRPAEIVTIPPGADLTVNGVFAGQTPCVLDQPPPGPVTLQLALPGLLPIDTVIIVKEGEPVGPFPPFIFQCRVHFNSAPAGAKISVNGHELSDMELARFTVSVTDTVNVAMSLEGEQPLPEAAFNPLLGFVAPSDTTVWRWFPRSEESPGELTGVFRREIRIHSDPPGAMVYVDGDSAMSGYTDLALPLPYGDHTITLRREPYMDYRFALKVGQETPGVFSAVLKRTVHISAVDRDDPGTDIGATIDWIRQGTSYLKSPFDDVKTPYSIQLGGLPHEILLKHEDYWDTTVTLDARADRLEVEMRRMSDLDRKERDERDDNNNESDAWVRFLVRNGDDPVADAEVIGVEKNTGVVVRYGVTGEAGQIITKVPPGDYDWRATKHGFEGQMNGERIKPGAGLKKITLKLVKP